MRTIEANDPMIKDLAVHFRNQVRDLVMDTVDTCARMDVPPAIRVSITVGVLAHVMVDIGRVIELDDAELHELLQLYMDNMRKKAATVGGAA